MDDSQIERNDSDSEDSENVRLRAQFNKYGMQQMQNNRKKKVDKKIKKLKNESDNQE